MLIVLYPVELDYNHPCGGHELIPIPKEIVDKGIKKAAFVAECFIVEMQNGEVLHLDNLLPYGTHYNGVWEKLEDLIEEFKEKTLDDFISLGDETNFPDYAKYWKLGYRLFVETDFPCPKAKKAYQHGQRFRLHELELAEKGN